MNSLAAFALTLGATLVVAAACGSAESHRVVDEAGGMSDAAGGSDDERPRGAGVDGGSLGDSAAGGSAAGTSSAGARSSGGASGGETEIDAAGSGGAASDPELPPTVTALGCFATSGDGWDFLHDARPAYVFGSSMICGGRQLSNDPDGFAPLETPTSFHTTRKFVIDDALLTASKVTLTFASDDAASFTLNGHALGDCMPPAGNIGFCSQTCQSFEFPAAYLLGNGQTNELDLEVINLLSVDAGNGHYGWTSISFSICAAAL